MAVNTSPATSGSIPPPDEEPPPDEPEPVPGRSELPPPLTDVAPPKYCPIDKRGDVATRPDVVVPALIVVLDPDWPDDGVTRSEPPRTAVVAPDEPADAALDALVYVPLPPRLRTDDAAYAPETAAVHKTQTIAILEIFRSFFTITLSTCLI